MPELARQAQFAEIKSIAVVERKAKARTVPALIAASRRRRR